MYMISYNKLVSFYRTSLFCGCGRLGTTVKLSIIGGILVNLFIIGVILVLKWEGEIESNG